MMAARTPNLRCAGLSDVGRVRSKNEDRYFLDPNRQIFIVSDGIGGHFGGELAATAVVELLPGQLAKVLDKPAARFDKTIGQEVVAEVGRLSKQILDETRDEPGLSGMGATLVLALIQGMRALLVHMGDSRVYRLRAGRLQQLTQDHSLVQLLVNAGEISSEESRTHPATGRLTRYVGMDGPALPEVTWVDLEHDDRLLLCTDGLSGMLDKDVLRDILQRRFDPREACRALVAQANAAGGKDNITAIVVAV